VDAPTKTAFTVYFDRRHQVVGHLFQGRFKSTVIGAEKYLLEVSRYLHLNPVRGVVPGQGTPIERRKRLREYRWSSWSSYWGYAAPGKDSGLCRIRHTPFVTGQRGPFSVLSEANVRLRTCRCFTRFFRDRVGAPDSFSKFLDE
jgi:hypothetical protein